MLFPVVASEEVDLLHSVMAVFSVKVPVQVPNLRVAVPHPLQQFRILGAIAVRLGTKEMPQGLYGSIGESNLAFRCRKFLFERLDDRRCSLCSTAIRLRSYAVRNWLFDVLPLNNL